MFNPLTYKGGGGGGVDASPHNVFPNFEKTIYSTMLKFSVAVHSSYLALPWQRHKYKQVLSKTVIFKIFLYFFQFFETELHDLFNIP